MMGMVGRLWSAHLLTLDGICCCGTRSLPVCWGIEFRRSTSEQGQRCSSRVSQQEGPCSHPWSRNGAGVKPGRGCEVRDEDRKDRGSLSRHLPALYVPYPPISPNSPERRLAVSHCTTGELEAQTGGHTAGKPKAGIPTWCWWFGL